MILSEVDLHLHLYLVVSISRINKQKCKVKKDTTIYERGLYLAYTDIILTNSGSNQTTLGHLRIFYLN